ncbi:S1C family serine protease, partial [Gammaproteobacteria bacterium]|nr:S1C family serine protease [Gammaproteobacteria bacterium]
MNFYTALLRRLLFGRWSPVLMLAVSALSGSMVLGSDAPGSQVAPQVAPQTAPQTAPPSYADFHTDDETNNIDIFKRASPSVVNITNSRLVRSPYSLNPQSVPQGSGTGFVWGDEGYIVTNFHVVQQANRVT